jgi:uncharacterized membrane protein YhhN
MPFQISNPILLYSSFILSAIFFITIRFPKLKGRWIIKGSSVFLLSVFAYYNCRSSIALLFTIALLFSSLGDAFLGFHEEKLFVQGLVSFLIAHILYSISFYSQFNPSSMLIGSHLILNIILIIYGAIMSKILTPKLGKLKIPVFIYMSALITMGIGGINTGFSNHILTYGVILFIISDSLLAIQKFLKGFKGIDYLIWLSYYLGQLFIIFGALKY